MPRPLAGEESVVESDREFEINAILKHSPNGVVLVDKEARIQFVNPSFRRMFKTGTAELGGKEAREVLGSDCFDRVIREGAELSVRGAIPEHGVHYRATLFRIENEGRYCGIFVDTTEEERARRRLSEVKAQTLARAQEVIRRQMQTVQEIAGLLGETTAETKVLLVRLMDLFRQEEPK